MNIDIISAVKVELEEQGKTLNDLFRDKIVSKNTFFKYRQHNPSLKTLLIICNYLKVSIDYLFDLVNEKNFRKYEIDSCNFYNNLILMIKSKNISGRQFCKNLNYSRDNINRWKNGAYPNITTLLEICKYFNCTIDELLR